MKEKTIKALKEEIGYRDKNIDCCGRCKHVKSENKTIDAIGQIYRWEYYCTITMNIEVDESGICDKFEQIRYGEL